STIACVAARSLPTAFPTTSLGLAMIALSVVTWSAGGLATGVPLARTPSKRRARPAAVAAVRAGVTAGARPRARSNRPAPPYRASRVERQLADPHLGAIVRRVDPEPQQRVAVRHRAVP